MRRCAQAIGLRRSHDHFAVLDFDERSSKQEQPSDVFKGSDAVTAPRRHRRAKVGSQQSVLGGGHVGDYHGRAGSSEEHVSGPWRRQRKMLQSS